ncbi:MAG: PPC domain-containing protein [Myxococcota bacterium]
MKARCILFFVVCALGCGNRTDGTGVRVECERDAECPVERPVCDDSGSCVECAGDSDCLCNEVCSESSCLPLGVVAGLLDLADGTELPPVENGHGVWEGTPGEDDYRFLDFCNSDLDCPGVSDICNPFTRGCVPASEAQLACPLSGECPAGLACDPASNRCLPAAVCRTNGNCCNQEATSCQVVGAGGLSLCLAVANECTPPAEVESECPFRPAVQGECPNGTDFCNASGRCVECVCDLDCGDRVCAVDGTCVGCRNDDDCNTANNEACDTVAGSCTARCNSTDDCPADEFCDTDDSVCRPLQNLPCDSDEATEPNNSSSQALANGINLTVPAIGESLDVGSLSLCVGDVADWFAVPLTRGVRLQVEPSSTTPLQADLIAVAPDGVTELDTGLLSRTGTDELDFIANFDGTYLIQVEPRPGRIGAYALSLTASTANPDQLCNDPFEDANGRNDSADTATVLNDPVAPPSDCSVNGPLGGSQTVSCFGNPLTLCIGERDYYRFEVPVGTTVRASLTGTSGDLNANLYGPFLSGEDLRTDRLADASSSIGTNESLEHTSRTGGTYLLEVVRFSGDAPTYSLNLSVEAGSGCDDDPFDRPTAADALDPASFNDVPATASGIALSPDLNGEAMQVVENLNLCTLDVDYFLIGLDDGVGGLAPLTPDQEFLVTIDQVSPGPDSNVLIFGALGDATVEERVTADPPETDRRTFALRPTTESTVYIGIRPRQQVFNTFDYRMTVSLINAPMCTPIGNESAATATLLDEAGGWPNEIIDPAGSETVSQCIDDVDYYQIALDEGERAIVTVEFDPADSDLAARGYDGTVVGEQPPTGAQVPTIGQIDDSAIGGSGAGFQWLDLNQSGSVYAAIYNRDGWLANYDLTVDLIASACAEDSFEPNNTWELAAPLTLDTFGEDPRFQSTLLRNGRVCSVTAGERDWYTINLGPEDQLTARLYNSPAQGALTFRLREPGPLGAATNGIIEDVEGPTGINRFVATVEYTVPSDVLPGDYLLEIEPRDPTGNNEFDSLYFLELNVVRACAEDSAEPSSQMTPFALGTAPVAETGFALCRDEDWYSVTVPANTPMTACVRFVHGDGDIDLFAYSALTPTDIDGLPQPLVAQSRQNIDPESVTLDPGGTNTEFFLRIALDGNEPERNTVYQLEVGDGISCP